MKKRLSVVLALAMVLSLCSFALADEQILVLGGAKG